MLFSTENHKKKKKSVNRTKKPKRESGKGQHSEEQQQKTWQISDLVVLQENEAEVELAEGQLQVFDVAMFVALLVGQRQHSFAATAQPWSVALPLGIQRRLQLILQSCESPLRLSQFLCEDQKRERNINNSVLLTIIIWFDYRLMIYENWVYARTEKDNLKMY